VSQKNPLLIKNGFVKDQIQGRDTIADILIEHGRIKWIWEHKNSNIPQLPEKCDVIDASGLIVAPGFIDLHCHLREPGFSEKETIESGTRAAAKGGFTTVCAMPNTIPAMDNVDMVKWVLNSASENAVIRVLPISAISVERKGEKIVDMQSLKEAGVVAFSDDGSVLYDVDLMTNALNKSRDLDLPIIQHSEDPMMVGNGVMHDGKIARKLGIQGISPESESKIVERDISLTARVDGFLHVAHVSSYLSLEHIYQAKKAGVRVSAEVTPHHLVFSHESLMGERGSQYGWPSTSQGSPIWRVNPPLRDALDVNSLIDALKGDVIDIIATDHAPHTLQDKSGSFSSALPGISGIETAFALLSTTLVDSQKIEMKVLLNKFTAAPASLLPKKYRDDGLGTIIEKGIADIVLIDPKRDWIVDPDELLSKGKNTPLAGCTLKGMVIGTVYGGELVFSDGIRIVNGV
jgi:dihydroorotase|tara:strand:- start:1136 stop:2518 length:1383 start_codon:yes stop_codon:yes gene_type:complete